MGAQAVEADQGDREALADKVDRSVAVVVVAGVAGEVVLLRRNVASRAVSRGGAYCTCSRDDIG